MTVETFKEQLRINNSSTKTIETYLKQMRPFLRFCDKEVTQEKINKYMIERRETVSTTSCNLFINALKKYCEYNNLEFQLPKQKNSKNKHHHYWKYEDFQNDILTYVHGEHEILLRFMFFTGCRPSEIFNIKKEHINYKQEEIIIKDGKGEKDREVPFLDKKLFIDLKQYMNSTTRTKIFNLNEQQLQYMFRSLKEQLSINEEICPYTMRRSFARHCIRIGFNDSSVQFMMGHEDIKTTMKYIQPDKQMVRDRWEEIKKQRGEN